MKKKTEVAVKITDKNIEKVREILEMFPYWVSFYMYKFKYIEYEGSVWEGVNYTEKELVKTKELRNILAKEHLKVGDVIICSIRSAKYIVKFKDFSNRSNGAFIEAEKYITIYSDGRISDTIMKGGSFTNFIRYATEEEKALLEPKKELEVGKWYKYDSYPKFLSTILNNGVRYGFDIFGNWFESKHELINNGQYTEATPQEVEKALIEEAKRRGCKGGFIFDERTNILWNQQENSIEIAILSNGKWADVIKNDDKPQVGDVCKFWDDKDDYFAIGILTSYNPSMIYPYDMWHYNGFKNAKKLTEQEVIDLLFKK